MIMKSIDIQSLINKFNIVDSSLINIGFSFNTRNATYMVLSSILNLGNIRFDTIDDDGCFIEDSSRPFLCNAAALLNMDEFELEDVLTVRIIKAADQQIKYCFRCLLFHNFSWTIIIKFVWQHALSFLEYLSI